jgi:hypothetical protein
MPIETVTKYVVDGREFKSPKEAKQYQIESELIKKYSESPIGIVVDWDVYDISFKTLITWMQHNKKLTKEIVKLLK